MIIPEVVVEIGRSIHETIPASVSKAMGPVWRESTEVIPVPEIYSKAPLSSENPPLKLEVATTELPPLKAVLILKIGEAVVEVAMVQENNWLSGMVEVAVAL